MRDPKRIPKVLETIRSIWLTYPDLRLGQLIANHVTDFDELYYIEDHNLIAALKASTDKATRNATEFDPA
jgi:hypothetical protein